MSNSTAGSTKQSENFWQKSREKARKHENTWDKARFVLADVPLNADNLKRVLPCAMWTGPNPMGTLFIANYGSVSFPLVPYHEAALLVHVRTLLGAGRHCCWMVVDDDTALILGRELLGYPKKLGSFEFEEKEGSILASVSRRGIKILDMEATRRQPQEPRLPVFNFKTFNAGAMLQFFALNTVWMFRPSELIHEYYSADVKLTINDSDLDPIMPLVAGGPQNGRMVVMDIPGDGYMLPAGIAGPAWFGRTFNMRFR